ncbi:MAG: peptidoglycan DD-metalloendopeptidase family protein [Azovibrio sp.]|uniref:M23 family metallopeptidase n=1 Tax=Azovibrio sp. TaxID=1872673 RepID=UPI003C717BBB
MIKRRILNHPTRFLDRLFHHRWAIAALGSVSALSMMAATAVPVSSPPPDGQLQVVEQLALQSQAPLQQGGDFFFREEKIARGDTFGSLMARLGIQDDEAQRFILNAPETQHLHRQLVAGRTISARTTESGELVTLYIPMSGTETVTIIERSDGKLKASEHPLQYETHQVLKSGEIRSTLFGATDAAGIPDSIAIQMAEIFSSDIDFHTDLRRGDHFSLVYEMQYYRGQPARSGRILSAEFVNDGKTYQAFYFDQDGKGAYYSADGKSRKKAFLRSPLEFSRVTSGFSMRLHPILKTWRAHKGVDYGAPTGTRVRATGDGIVAFIGKQGGYGNLVIISHAGGYQTYYAHLKGFASNLRKGSRISQGDHIGYVGQTGWATGPHLHYEFHVKGDAINPLSIAVPTTIPLSASQQPHFRAQARQQLAMLQLLQEAPSARFE